MLAELSPIRRFDVAPQYGRVSLWWDHTPLDLISDAGDFGGDAASRVRTVPFEGSELPVLDAVSLAVPAAVGWLERILGRDHDATTRLAALVQSEA